MSGGSGTVSKCFCIPERMHNNANECMTGAATTSKSCGNKKQFCTGLGYTVATTKVPRVGPPGFEPRSPTE